jgi:NAD(P)-dependent dehydrogenase (short-subunit alcohol dehydrogenase family)
LCDLTDEVGGSYRICDITDPEKIDSTAARILSEYGSVSVLVNNAGMPLRERFSEASADQVAEVMKTNFEGTYRFTEALQPGLEEAATRSGHADIINIVSAAAGILDPHSGAYGASKAAQSRHSRSLTADLRPLGISVHAIHPGRADTPGHPQKANRSLISKALAKFTETDVDEIAGAVVDRIGENPREIYVPGLLHGVAVLEEIAPVTVTRVMDKLFS